MSEQAYDPETDVTEELQVAMMPSPRAEQGDYRRGIIVLEFATPPEWPEAAHDRVVHAIEGLFGQAQNNVSRTELTFEERAAGNGPGMVELLGLFMKSWVNRSADPEAMAGEESLMKWRLEYPIRPVSVPPIDEAMLRSPVEVIRPVPVFSLGPLSAEELIQVEKEFQLNPTSGQVMPVPNDDPHANEEQLSPYPADRLDFGSEEGDRG